MRVLLYGVSMWIAVGVPAALACAPVTGNRIEGRDLAAANPLFASLPATLTLGFAPLPGAKRVFSSQELARIAKANGIEDAGTGDVCFEVPMVPLTAERVSDSMREALSTGTVLKIVELPGISVPVGAMEFPLTGLEPATFPGRGVQLWRGHVRYAESRQFAIWARVEVTMEYRAVVAMKDLPAGMPITAEAVRMEIRRGPIEREKPASRLEDVDGRIALRAVKAGAFVPLAALAVAPSVRRGDAVSVEVQSGPAHLHFEAIAQSTGRTGEMVELRNPMNGKTFRARLDEGARASIVIGGGRKP